MKCLGKAPMFFTASADAGEGSPATFRVIQFLTMV
jgi:hypothetical protein